MKSKYHFSIERDIFTIYTVALFTAVGGAALWAMQHIPTPVNNQQPIPVEVQKSSTGANPNIQYPAIIKPTQVSKLPKSVTPANIPSQKLTSKVKVAISRMEPKAYWLKFEGKDIKLVSQKVAVKEGTSKELALKQAIDNLLTNPQTTSLTTTIPAGTKLLSLQIKNNEIHVNLSSEFTTGGGSTSMIYRVAQVIYTASSINTKAKVYIYVEGQLLDEDYPLGGEGLVFNEPLTRQQLIKDFSIN